MKSAAQLFFRWLGKFMEERERERDSREKIRKESLHKEETSPTYF